MRSVWNRARKTKRANGPGFYDGVLDRYDNDPGVELDGVMVSYAETVKHMSRELCAHYDRWNNQRIMNSGGVDHENPNARSVRDIIAQYSGGQVIQLQNPEAVAGHVTGGVRQSTEYGHAVTVYRKRAQEGEDVKGKGPNRNWSHNEASAANAAHKEQRSNKVARREGTIRPEADTPHHIRHIIPVREDHRQALKDREKEIDPDEANLG